MYFGVICHKQDYKKEHRRLIKILQELDGNVGPDDLWPWSQWDPREVNYKNLERNQWV